MPLVAEFLHYPLQGGLNLYLLPTKRFKTVTFKVYLYLPLDERVTATSLMVQVMRRGSRKYPTMRRILIFLEECYGAGMNLTVLKIGERHVIYLKLEAISDRYLPRGRNLDRVLRFLREMLLHPAVAHGGLRADIVEQEKRNLRNTIEGMINGPWNPRSKHSSPSRTSHSASCSLPSVECSNAPNCERQDTACLKSPPSR